MSMFREASKDGVPGDVSIRRVIAFICTLSSIMSGGLAIFMKCEWQTVAVASALPLAAMIILLLFTTLTELKEIAMLVAQIKGGKGE